MAMLSNALRNNDWENYFLLKFGVTFIFLFILFFTTKHESHLNFFLFYVRTDN